MGCIYIYNVLANYEDTFKASHLDGPYLIMHDTYSITKMILTQFRKPYILKDMFQLSMTLSHLRTLCLKKFIKNP